jgi:tetratricopeptide (TPR) repeat protein
LRWKDGRRSVPFFALSLLFGLTTVWFQYHWVLRGTTFRPEGFLSKLAAAGWVVWFYLGKILWPVNLSVIYPKWNVDPSRWISWFPALLVAACLALFWWKRRTWGRPMLFGLGYFAVTLFPVLGFFDQGFYDYSLVADHWQYYSMIGVVALAVAAGAVVCRRIGDRGRMVGVLASAVVVVVLGIATWTRAGVYATSETLWSDTVTKNPDAWMAQYNLGLALGKAGKLDEAIAHFRRAVQIKPGFAEAHNFFGTALLQAGRGQEAIEQYRQALRIKPDYVEAQVNLDRALSRESSGGN